MDFFIFFKARLNFFELGTFWKHLIVSTVRPFKNLFIILLNELSSTFEATSQVKSAFIFKGKYLDLRRTAISEAVSGVCFFIELYQLSLAKPSATKILVKLKEESKPLSQFQLASGSVPRLLVPALNRPHAAGVPT